jgi:hypothetical protein
VFTVRPLFFPTPSAEAPKLERALHKLTRLLRETLHFLGKELRHDELARYAFNPELDARRIDVAIELRRRAARCRFLFVQFEALERRIARSLDSRAAEVLSEHFRRREREDQEEFIPPENFTLEGSAWIHPHDVEIHPAPVLAKADDAHRMFLGPKAALDGERELFGRRAHAAPARARAPAGAAAWSRPRRQDRPAA